MQDLPENTRDSVKIFETSVKTRETCVKTLDQICEQFICEQDPATPTRIEIACMFSHMFSHEFHVFSREDLRKLRMRELMPVRTRVGTGEEQQGY